LQEKIREGEPIDENHPGFDLNLTPNQQEQFKDIVHNGGDGPKDPEDEEKLDDLKKVISDGLPLDVTHPGMENLIPRQ